ncbi:MAG: DUF6084 family protein [Pirellulales bacterium]
MLDLTFRIAGAEPAASAATPQLCFKLHIDAAEACRDWPIQAVLLRIQVRIEPTRRSYQTTSGPGLEELFGAPQRWGATMRSMLWTHANVLVPPFTGSALVDVPIECTYDFNVAATKYFAALDDGDIPLCFLFSGTCFYQTERGLQAAQISWEREANFRLAVRTWQEMMARYYPNCAWLCVHKDAFDRLHEFKTSHALPTWELALERLLDHAAPPAAIED